MGSEYQDIKRKRRIYTTEIIKESRESANWLFILLNICPILRGPTQNSCQKLKIYIYVEKAFSGMGEMCPKILGGYEY